MVKTQDKSFDMIVGTERDSVCIPLVSGRRRLNRTWLGSHGADACCNTSKAMRQVYTTFRESQSKGYSDETFICSKYLTWIANGLTDIWWTKIIDLHDKCHGFLVWKAISIQFHSKPFIKILAVEKICVGIVVKGNPRQTLSPNCTSWNFVYRILHYTWAP